MKPSSRSIALLILTAALTALFGAGCRNTVSGVGHDVERAGHNIHKSVN
jgi:predicted small secreted protein